MRQANRQTASFAHQSFTMANHGEPLRDDLSHSGYGGTSVPILLSGDHSVGHGPVPSWSREEDWKRQDETLCRLVKVRQRSFDEREKGKQLEKEQEEKSTMEVEGGDYGTDETSPQ